jgi:hypothetical protein
VPSLRPRRNMRIGCRRAAASCENFGPEIKLPMASSCLPDLLQAVWGGCGLGLAWGLPRRSNRMPGSCANSFLAYCLSWSHSLDCDVLAFVGCVCSRSTYNHVPSCLCFSHSLQPKIWPKSLVTIISHPSHVRLTLPRHVQLTFHQQSTQVCKLSDITTPNPITLPTISCRNIQQTLSPTSKLRLRTLSHLHRFNRPRHNPIHHILNEHILILPRLLMHPMIVTLVPLELLVFHLHSL